MYAQLFGGNQKVLRRSILIYSWIKTFTQRQGEGAWTGNDLLSVQTEATAKKHKTRRVVAIPTTRVVCERVQNSTTSNPFRYFLYTSSQ